MKTFSLSITILVYFSVVFAQKSNQADYYVRLDVNNFRKDNLLNQQIDISNPDYTRLNAAIFFATNEQRVKHRLPEVTYSAKLEESAFMHSKDMCEKNFFNHNNPRDKKKKTPTDRAKLVGIINPYIAENIATAFGLQYEQGRDVFPKGYGKFSYTSNGDLILPNTYIALADALVKSWMNSEGHRKNILSKNALQLGCGAFLYFDKNFNQMPTFKATQNFQEYEVIKTMR